jgi:hypothetical protein
MSQRQELDLKAGARARHVQQGLEERADDGHHRRQAYLWRAAARAATTTAFLIATAHPVGALQVETNEHCADYPQKSDRRELEISVDR